MRTLPLLLLAACGGDSWTVVDPLSQPRHHHTITTLADGDALVVGGFGNQGEALPTVERWTGKGWEAAANLPDARGGHTATLLPDGRVLVIGGFVGEAQIRSAFVYLPDSDQWGALTEMPFGRGGHTATLLPDGTIFVHGGSTDFNAPGPMIFDPVAETWTSFDSIEGNARFAHGASLFDDSGRVLIAGGVHEVDPETRRLVVAGSALRFDPVGGAWDDESSMFEPRAWHAQGQIPGGVVMVAGGTALPEPTEGDSIDSVEVFEGGSWELLGSLSTSRMRAVTASTDSAILVIGGDTTDAFPSAVVDIVDPIHFEVVPAADMPSRRTHHAAATLPGGDVLVVGGWDGLFASSAAEIYRPRGKYR